MKKFILPLFVLSSIITSCQKDPKKCELSSANLVGTYKITANGYKKDADSPMVDVYANYRPCEKDDLIIFNANNTITFSDAGVKCAPPGDSTGNWTLSGNNVNIKGRTYVVSSFDCSAMSGSVSGNTPGELTTVTLTRQ